ncbi:FecR family protein [Sphingomonas sp. TX0543]|uniref:FecR family protein n=1 Tax=Sphingomonas sp. TX0543 TaxID=3399682 RepID=UPI003AFA76DA
MTDIDDTILDAAIAWHIRQTTMNEREWSDFVSWLEADPAHARAYDIVSVADAARHSVVDEVPIAANDDERSGDRAAHGRWRGFALAAASLAAVVAGLVGVTELRRTGATPVEVAAAQPRSLALPDGTQVAMAAGARMTVGSGQRSASVQSGRVSFRVTHDADHPFTVRVGDWEIQDIGTVFSVAKGARGVDLSVSEGSVLFDPGNNRIALHAGEALTILSGQRVVRSRIDSDQARTVVFSGQSIQFVAETISLVLGRDIGVDEGIAQSPFTGIVRLTGDPQRYMAHFAELTGMRVSHDGNGWIIAPQRAPMH